MTALIFQGSSADSTTSGRSESAAAVECGGMMGSLMRGVAKSLSLESRENRQKLQTGPMGGSYSHARPQGGTDLNRSADPNSSRLAPAAGELLDKYTRALDSLCSTITKAEIRVEYDLAFAADWPEPFYRGMRDKGVRYERTEFRTDGKRLHSRMYTWAHIAPQWPDVPEKEAHYNCLNFADGTLYQNNTNLHPSTRGLVGLFKQPALKIRDTEVHLTGYPLQSDDRLDTVLRRARSLSVRSKTERVGDADCHVVDADTDHGRISVWIDPTHGYHLAKMQAKETQGDLYWGKPLPSGQSLNAAIEITHFEKIGSVWVPMDADISLDKRLGPGAYTIQKTRYRRTEVLVNPDHDALGSFDNPLENPKNDSLLKNGTYVIRGNEPIRYRWQDGKLVPDERQPKTKRTRPAPQGRGEVP